MKSLRIIFPFLLLTSVAMAQSSSYQTLKNKFSDSKDVHSFSVNGFFARAILWMADEYEFKKAISEVKSIRLMTIPKSEFKDRGVSLSGYKKLLERDAYEQLAHVRDHGDDVTFYLQSTKKQGNRYMVLVEESDEVVVIEMRGYIDPTILLDNTELAYKKQ
ncbi:MAG: DUF4252 domain-containing protein [Cyclobacteriaceae bacterium]|nr:DUF4252 domain-containing protein [Cyclobacteriaceae bacterium]